MQAIDDSDSAGRRNATLGYVLLSLLARRDRTGYELYRFTSSPRSDILWSAGHSQIYKELAKLAKDGLVAFTAVAQSERPDKKVYRITPRGRDALRRWVLTPPRATLQKSELAVKAHACWLVEPDRAAALFHECAQSADREIDAIRKHRQYLEESTRVTFPPRGDDPLFGAYASIMFAIDSRRQLAKWCRWCAERLTEVIQDEVDER